MKSKMSKSNLETQVCGSGTLHLKRRVVDALQAGKSDKRNFLKGGNIQCTEESYAEDRIHYYC